jgi:hypothetical protein
VGCKRTPEADLRRGKNLDSTFFLARPITATVTGNGNTAPLLQEVQSSKGKKKSRGDKRKWLMR